MTEREAAIAALFTRIAPGYDLLNTVISLGQHRGWRRRAVQALDPEPHWRCLDLCAGTGEFARALLPRCRQVVAADLSLVMLRRARQRCGGSLPAVVADGFALPFPTATFDCITNGFGLRHCETDLPAFLAESRRVLRPGGRLMILELSHPPSPLWRRLTGLYIHGLLPLIGGLYDRQAYAYLSRSLAHYPDAEGLRQQLLAAGFSSCKIIPLLGGVAAVHVAQVAGEGAIS
jgi:demethylmenaquinone methyltransferase/2-methoxy-6-polyprenyl-1,4-benzoquinol methylase